MWIFFIYPVKIEKVPVGTKKLDKVFEDFTFYTQLFDTLAGPWRPDEIG